MEGTAWVLRGTASRFQKITDSISMLARVEAQYTNSLLTSTNQYSVGGPSNVRAYNVSEFLVDRAMFASMEWTFDAPLIADAPFDGARDALELAKIARPGVVEAQVALDPLADLRGDLAGIRIADELAVEGGGSMTIERFELWDMPLFFGLLIVLLGSEWGLRRRAGMA